MKLSVTIAVISLLLIGTAIYVVCDDSIATADNKPSTIVDGTTIRIVDITPKDWRDTVSAISTIVLAVFTIVLAVVTWYYAVQAKKNVMVSKELLDSNKELIELNKAQSDIAKAQLFSTILELDNMASGKSRIKEPIGGDDANLVNAISIYLSKAGEGLLGEDLKKVQIKLKDNHSGGRNIRGYGDCKPGETVTIPKIIWEHHQKAMGGNDSAFKFLRYVDPE